MKNKLIIILLACAFFSCKKNSKNEQPLPQKEYTVSFDLKGFTQTFEPIQKTNALTGMATDSIARMARLIIFDAQGKFHRKVIGFKDKVNLILPAGNYTAIIVGCDTRYFNNLVVFDETLSSSSLSYYVKNAGGMGGLRNFEDTFYKKITFSVNKSDVEQTVTLNRINTRLQVNILDAIPPKADYILVSVDSIPRVFSTNTGKPILNGNKSPQFISYYVKSTDIGKTNFKLSTDFLPDPNDEVTISIKGYDYQNKVFASKVINNVKFNVNKITVLNGNVFGGNGTTNGNLTVKADSTWSSEVIYKSF